MSATTGRGTSPLGSRRVRLGLLLAVVVPVVLGGVLVAVRDVVAGPVGLASDLLLFLLVTVVCALVGGVAPALLSAVVGFVLVNFLFTAPRFSLGVRDADDVVALLVYLSVALLVSGAVDVAARRTREAARAAAEKDALAEVDRTRTALLAAVGHDLRTPLAAARTSVATLADTRLRLSEADREELLATTGDSLVRLTDLIADLLDLSRLQAGVLAVDLRPVAVEEVLARAADSLGPDGRLVRLEVGPGAPTVLADAGLLERVLANLAANALRYSPPGRPPSITAACRGSEVVVRVVDHGPGIPADRHDEVFVPFQRLGDTDNSTGVGLGLALSRGLTEAMHGRVQPEETPGGGLTMRLSLPAAADGGETALPGVRERSGGAA